MFQQKYFNRVMALFVFLVAFITYWRTIAPTVSFWDCGEFIACSYILGIPHPPGAPFYLLIGRIFSMIPFVEDIALRVNVISAITSAITVMLTYLIIVRLIQIWRGTPKTLEDRVIVYASGVLGALTFAFTDTLWFNAVEAEVYAISMFFTAIVVWLVLIWYEKADDPSSDRYLLLIMFCIGLSIGIHLLNVLTLPAITLLVYFRKYRVSFGKLFLSTLIAAASFGVGLVFMKVILTLLYPIYQPVLLPFIQLLFPTVDKLQAPDYGTAALLLFPIFIIVHLLIYRQSSEFRDYASVALLVAVATILLVAIYPGVVKGVPWLVDKGEFTVINPLILVTISVAVVFYLFPKLELTGSFVKISVGMLFAAIGIVSLFWFFVEGNRVWEVNILLGAILLFAFVALGYGFSKWMRNRIFNLVIHGLLLVLISCSSYLMIFIRSGLDPAIDENDPETTKALVSYLNREQYGQWSISDRKRWKPESRFTYEGEMDYLWRYQIKRMYLRYFAWQFMGKGNTYDADSYIKETFSFRGLYWLPFLLGLIGMIYHFWKDWRQALFILILFLMTGLAIVIYLNQEDPQPRERDYVYVASFFAYAIWIGLGVTAILDKIRDWFQEEETRRVLYMGFIIILIAFLIPINMYAFNFESHDRTGNYVAYDYSYNILQSCEKDAILFTNGDNDTFPLWFLQNCVRDPETGEMGIRKDIRVVNLSLLNTPWYIKQLKNEEPKVPISLTDAEIEALMPVAWKPVVVSIDVPEEQYLQDLPDIEERHRLLSADSTEDHEIAFEVAPTLGSRERGGIRVQDRMILDIVDANRWRKPIYFAVTVSRQNQLISRKRKDYNIERYLRMDGLAFRLTTYPDAMIAPSIIEKKLYEEFQYRGLNDPAVYFNENIMGLLTNYRAGFMRLALHYYEQKDFQRMVEILDKMEEKVPQQIIPIDNYQLVYQIGQLYNEAGQREKYIEAIDRAAQIAPAQAKLSLSLEFSRLGLWRKAEELAQEVINKPGLSDDWNQQAQSFLTYIQDMKKRAEAESLKSTSVPSTDTMIQIVPDSLDSVSVEKE